MIRDRLWKPWGLLVVVVLAGALSTWGGAPAIAGSLIPVSGPSPFAGCTADLIGGPGGPPVLNVEWEPYLAVNPTNPNNLVALWAQDYLTDANGHYVAGARGVVVGASFNGGATWSEIVLPGNSPCTGGSADFGRTGGDVWLAFAPNGDLYASTLALSGHPDVPPMRVLVNKSTDGGLTWGPATELFRDDFINDKGTMVADPFDPNFVYIVWTDRTNGGWETMFSRTTDGGQTWEPARVIYELSGGGDTNDKPFGNLIVALRDGSLVTFFTEILSATDQGGVAHFTHRISLLRSTDRGATWSPRPKKEAIHVADMQVGCAADEFLADLCVTDPDSSQRVRTGGVVFDAKSDPRTGYLYVVWEDRRFSGGQFTDIAFSMSADGGFTWSAPIRVNQTPASPNPANRQAFVPNVAVTANGTVGVAYYDFRMNDAGPGALTDYWLVQCRPTSTTACTDPANWSSEVRLTDASFDILQAPKAPVRFLGDYMCLQSSGNDFLSVFGQTQATDPAGIFFRRIHAPTSVIGPSRDLARPQSSARPLAGLHARILDSASGGARLRFALSVRAPVSLALYDVAGRRVRALLSSTMMEPGDHEIEWDGRADGGAQVAKGVYFYTIEVPGQVMSRRTVLLK